MRPCPGIASGVPTAPIVYVIAMAVLALLALLVAGGVAAVVIAVRRHEGHQTPRRLTPRASGRKRTASAALLAPTPLPCFGAAGPSPEPGMQIVRRRRGRGRRSRTVRAHRQDRRSGRQAHRRRSRARPTGHERRRDPAGRALRAGRRCADRPRQIPAQLLGLQRPGVCEHIFRTQDRLRSTPQAPPVPGSVGQAGPVGCGCRPQTGWRPGRASGVTCAGRRCPSGWPGRSSSSWSPSRCSGPSTRTA